MLHYVAMGVDTSMAKNASPDEINWELMDATRRLAIRLEMFDPAIIAASVGKLIHGHACEMSNGDFMVLDLSADRRVLGFASDYSVNPEMNSDTALIIPNHTVMAIEMDNDMYIVKMCKGYNIPFALPDRAIGFGPKDPSYP